MSIKTVTVVDILIPTFNRAGDLEKNIILISEMAQKEGCTHNYNVLISDNNSTDLTSRTIEKLKKILKLKIKYYKQAENVGLEKNAVFLLSRAKSDFVMYIGDDDFLPNGYLSYVVEKIKDDPMVGAVVPGFSSYYANGSIVPARNAEFFDKKFDASVQAVLNISNYGHQMSGLVFRRENILENYTAKTKFRNLYPFIYFLSFNALTWNSYYAPGFQVLVTQGNAKAWSYDDLGLLPDIFKNYRILFPNSIFYRVKCCLAFTSFQSWRLSVDKSIVITTKAFFRFISSPQIELVVKFAYLPIYSNSIFKLILDKLKRKLTA